MHRYIFYSPCTLRPIFTTLHTGFCPPPWHWHWWTMSTGHTWVAQYLEAYKNVKVANNLQENLWLIIFATGALHTTAMHEPQSNGMATIVDWTYLSCPLETHSKAASWAIFSWKISDSPTVHCSWIQDVKKTVVIFREKEKQKCTHVCIGCTTQSWPLVSGNRTRRFCLQKNQWLMTSLALTGQLPWLLHPDVTVSRSVQSETQRWRNNHRLHVGDLRCSWPPQTPTYGLPSTGLTGRWLIPDLSVPCNLNVGDFSCCATPQTARCG